MQVPFVPAVGSCIRPRSVHHTTCSVCSSCRCIRSHKRAVAQSTERPSNPLVTKPSCAHSGDARAAKQAVAAGLRAFGLCRSGAACVSGTDLSGTGASVTGVSRSSWVQTKPHSALLLDVYGSSFGFTQRHGKIRLKERSPKSTECNGRGLCAPSACCRLLCHRMQSSFTTPRPRRFTVHS